MRRRRPSSSRTPIWTISFTARGCRRAIALPFVLGRTGISTGRMIAQGVTVDNLRCIAYLQGDGNAFCYHDLEGTSMKEAPLTISVPEAGERYFGLCRNASYLAAARGDIPVIKIGIR